MAKQPEQPAITQIYPWCVFIIFLGILGGGLVYPVIIQIEFNRVKNPQESQLAGGKSAVYKHGQGFEPGTTVKKSS